MGNITKKKKQNNLDINLQRQEYEREGKENKTNK